jgi:hypothetical protein
MLTPCREFDDLGLEARCLLGPAGRCGLAVENGCTRVTPTREGGQPTAVRVRAGHTCLVRAFAADLATPPAGGGTILTFSNEQ